MESNESGINPENEKGKKLRKMFRLKHIIGLLAGGIAGFLYYYFVGCQSGACALKSSPLYNIVLGLLLGYLIADFIPSHKNNSK